MQEIMSSFEKHTIEHQRQPEGGRELSIYEAQLQFDRKDLHGKRVLDLGAGPQLKFAQGLKDFGIKAEVTSLSPDFADEKHARKAQKSFPEGKMVAGVGQELPFKDSAFDKIFAFHLGEHLSREGFFQTITEMARVLSSGGEAKFGPTLNIPGEWDPYQAILGNQETKKRLDNYGVMVIKEDIPETVMPKARIKDSFANVFHETSYNIVLRKKSQPEHSK